MESTKSNLATTLNRSNELHAIIMHEVYLVDHDRSIRSVLTKSLSGISLEHSNSIMLLMTANNYTTAVSLLRLQYEAVARAMWTHLAAKDSFLAKYAAPTDITKLPPDFPTITEMIEQISKGQVKGPGEMLSSFKEATWSGMNSYVHNGFLPIERFLNGYPEALLIQIVQGSNALNIMVAMVLARMSGDYSLVSLVKQLQIDYKDSLPTLEPFKTIDA
ncbi:MAG: hypothetical protein HOP04_01360 [Methylophilaceae bacterium]|nr:hypothetical protein [Methylophilaceae bacterium]